MGKEQGGRKSFNFAVEIDGLRQFLVQSLTLPEVSIESVKHGDTNYDVKTAGRVMVDDLVLEKIMPLNQSDTWAIDWLTSAQNPATGGGDLPLNYKQQIVIRELDPTGVVILNSWVGDGAWVAKVKPGKYTRGSSDSVIEEVTISLDRFTKI